MSAGQPVPLAQAQLVAEELRQRLLPACERLEVAGSIRRRRPTVADIELVAIPAIGTEDGGDLWGTAVDVDLLDRALTTLILDAGELEPRDVEVRRADGTIEHQQRLGQRYRALVYRGLPVDLFIVRDPAQWGVIFTIRTGPADWSQRLVTDCQRYLRRVEGGYLYRAGQRVPCLEERDFLEAIGQPWVEPPERSASRVAIRAEVAT